MRRRIILVIILAAFGLAGLYVYDLASSKGDYFAERMGRLVRTEAIASGESGGHSETLHLVSTTGLEVDMRVRRPADPVPAKLPVLVLVGGHQTGKDAVDLVGEPDGMAFAAIDYPYPGETVVEGFREVIQAIPRIQRAFIDTPPALSLALSWILRQPWADPERVELVGVSLGVPFAAAAGGVDDRFSRVWLIHGGADNVSWVAHAGRRQIENATLRRWVARAALFMVYGRSLQARDWIPEIAPRPVVIIVARDDDYVPPEAQEPFIRLARDHDNVELIWTEGLHIRPQRREELQQLLDIVLSRVRRGGQYVETEAAHLQIRMETPELPAHTRQ